MPTTSKRIAFVGAGWTQSSRAPEKSEAEYVLQACLNAAEDAGLDPAEIDGLNIQPHHGEWDRTPIVKGLGMRDVRYDVVGGGGPASAARAAEALDAGVCKAIAVCKVMNTTSFVTPIGTREWDQFELPYGLGYERERCGLYLRRYMHRYGITPEQIGSVAIVEREHAIMHPFAYQKKPLTMDDYLSSRVIADPVRLLDCDIPVNGAWAYIVTREDLAKTLRHPPVYMMGWAEPPPAEHPGGADHMINEPTKGISPVGQTLWKDTGLSPKDIDVSFVYDGFSFYVLMWMENLGLVGRGEAGAFVEGGDRIRITGELPTNTHGGNLSGGRMHGSGHFLEAMAQLRGEAGPRQAKDPQFAVLSMALPYSGSVCVLGRA